MSDLPPPPSAPPPDQPQPYWAAPATQAPPRRRGPSLLVLAAIGAAVVLVLVAVGAYALAGNSVASSRLSSADGALNTTISHQSAFEESMSQIAQSFESGTGANFSPTQYRTTVGQFVKSSQQEQTNVASDRSRLDAAAAKLHDTEWLTLFSKGRLDHESERIRHADTALDAAKTMSADLVQDGAFFQAYADSLVDLDDLVSKSQSKDIVGANAAVAKLKTDVDKALSLTNAPGLPYELHMFIAHFQQLAVDFENVLNAAEAGNGSALNAAEAKGNTDISALSNVDTSAIGAEIKGFYEPYESKYQQEMRLAAS